MTAFRRSLFLLTCLVVVALCTACRAPEPPPTDKPPEPQAGTDSATS